MHKKVQGCGRQPRTSPERGSDQADGWLGQKREEVDNVLRKELLEGAQSVVSAGLLGEGIKVAFDAECPHADLENRVMHLRPLPEEVSEVAMLHLRADCDHEMGHFGATDPKALSKSARPIIKLLTNAIEDGFIERWVSDRWLGCAQNLAASNEKLAFELRAKFEDKTASEEEQVNGRRARAVNGLQMLAFGHPIEKVYETFGDDLKPVFDEVDDLLPELPEVEHTRDSVRLATAFADRWRWGKPEEPPKSKPSASSAAESLRAEIEAPGGTPKLKDTGKTSKLVKAEIAKAESEVEEAIVKAIAPLVLGEFRKATVTELTFTDRTRYRAYTAEDAVIEIQPLRNDSLVGQFVTSVRHVVPPLRRRLIMEFSGVGQRFELNRRRGQVDQRALHKVALGSDRIFRQKMPEVIIDADVTLLVDASGSMRGSVGGHEKIYIAAQAACAFSLVLDHLHISHETLAFSTKLAYGSAVHEHPAKYERVRPLNHIIVKSAEMTFRQARSRFAALAYYRELFENCDGESVMWAAQRLAARNRAGMKPILMVFSDGEPASSPEECSVLNSHLKRTVQRIEAAGITCVGIGIGSKSVSKFYKNHTIIENIGDLVKTSYTVIRAALRSARRRSA